MMIPWLVPTHSLPFEILPHFYPTQQEADAACWSSVMDEPGFHDITRQRFNGCSHRFYVDGKLYCEIFVPNPSQYGFDESVLETIGHEIVHCTHGNFHP